MIRLPDDDSPAVSILVLLDGAAEMAERCLRAIAAAHDPAVPCETVVVLNRPGAELEALVLQRTAGARVVLSRANMGPAVGWNVGAAVARAPRLAVVHEDAEPDAGWLPPLVAAMAARRAGVTGSRLFWRDGTLQSCGWRLRPDASPELLDAATAPEVAAATHPTEADMVSGAAMLVDRELLDAAGGFDERFFPALFTDIDVCLASWCRGRPVLSVPASTARHDTGAIEVREDPLLTGPRVRLFLFERQRPRFLQKWGAEVHARRLLDPPPRASRAFTEGMRLVQRDERLHVLPAELERRLDAAERQVTGEFCAWLGQREEAAVAEAASLREQAAASAAELERLRRDAHTLQLILDGRWWRLRNTIHRAIRRR